MVHSDIVYRWLARPPLTGWRAIFGTIAAIALPTLLRGAVDTLVTGVAFTPYMAFVLAAAVLIGAGHAAAVALGGALISDTLFVGSPFRLLEGATDIFGITVFLATSALVIGLVQAARTIVRDRLRANGGQSGDGIVFSTERGQAWASWSGTSAHVRLGPQEEVAEMMKDYLAQLELGRRLEAMNSKD
jgi:hypothetical protein